MTIKSKAKGFTAGNDKQNGTTAGDFLDGLAGNDTIFGLAGNDTLIGSAGNDSLDGGVDDDDIDGDSGNDKLLGGDGDDTLDGGSGIDNMTGGNGNDFYVVDNAGDKVIENANGGDDTVASAVTFSLANKVAVENLILTGDKNLTATGNGGDNVLIGNDGNNLLIGGTGADSLDGGLGNDTAVFKGKKSSYSLSEDENGFILVQETRSGDTTYVSNVESLRFSDKTLDISQGLPVPRLSISDAQSIVEGNSGTTNVTLTVTLSASATESVSVYYATLDGTATQSDNDYTPTAGMLSFDVGETSQTLSIDVLGDTTVESDETFTVTLFSPTNGSLYNTTSAAVITISNDDNAAFDGLDISLSDADDNFKATPKNDRIDGLAGNDTIDGREGNDSLTGGLGNELLAGDLGNDTLNGGEGNDDLIGDIGNDILNGGAGDDWLAGDFAYGDDANDIVNGDAGNDTLFGAIGDDVLNGGDGNDTFGGDVSFKEYLFPTPESYDPAYAYSSEQGKDTLDGGKGNDTFYAGNGDDFVLGGEGDDVLNKYIEGKVFLTKEEDPLKGNKTLDGGAGHDTLYASKGNDTLIGGTEEDKFVFDTGNSGVGLGLRDIITDFLESSSVEVIDLAAVSPNTLRFIGSSAFTGADQVRYTSDSAANMSVIAINLDADLAPEMEIELTGVMSLAAEDFVL